MQGQKESPKLVDGLYGKMPQIEADRATARCSPNIRLHGLGTALAIYSYEADVVAMLIAADDDYSLFPPNCASMINRDVIGIVTKIDKAPPERAENWLRLSGCHTVFHINSHTG